MVFKDFIPVQNTMTVSGLWGFCASIGATGSLTFLASQFVKINPEFTGIFAGSTDTQLFQIGGFSGPLCIILTGGNNATKENTDFGLTVGGIKYLPVHSILGSAGFELVYIVAVAGQSVCNSSIVPNRINTLMTSSQITFITGQSSI